MNYKNPYINARIEFHILQSFPVTCLNRDDVGSPKTATVGGCTRARVSSQCWKRQVRLEMQKLGVTTGTRTKLLKCLIAEACRQEGATEEQAEVCSESVESIFIKTKKKGENQKKEHSESENINEQNDTLIFLSPNEVQIIAQELKKANFDPNKLFTSKKRENDFAKIVKKTEGLDGADIALFGRMVAKACQLNVEAASSFSHAISTHKIGNEVEFFTALDDLEERVNSSHLGSLEFNSSTYYRYISLDLGQLAQTLKGLNVTEVVEAFTKALFVAVPSARQSTMSGASQWDYAKILVRKGQRLQLPFETPIKSRGGGFLQPSIDALKEELCKKEKRAGSLFGKLSEYTFGESDFSIDDLVASLKTDIEEIERT